MVINTVYHFVDSDLGVQIYSKKQGFTEKENECVEIEDRGTSTHLY